MWRAILALLLCATGAYADNCDSRCCQPLPRKCRVEYRHGTATSSDTWNFDLKIEPTVPNGWELWSVGPQLKDIHFNPDGPTWYIMHIDYVLIRRAP